MVQNRSTAVKLFGLRLMLGCLALGSVSYLTEMRVRADEPKPPIDTSGASVPIPQPTVTELKTELAAKDQQIAEQAAELRLYQQGLFQCQATEIHAQAKAQANPKQPKGK